MSKAWPPLALLIASRADASFEVSLVSAPPPKAEAIEFLESDMVNEEGVLSRLVYWWEDAGGD
jgi:hypothetical protein